MGSPVRAAAPAAGTARPRWHARPVAELAAELATSLERGLSSVEAAERLARDGENALPETPGKGALRRFAEQFAQPLVLVLLVAGCVTAALGELVDSGVIFAVTLINAVVGYILEGRAENALAALARSAASAASVLRDGVRLTLPAAQLVRGDVVVLAAGDKVPADLRLFRARELQTIEAALTGESAPSAKFVDPPAVALATVEADPPLAERPNMAFAGTIVASGHGAGIVVAVGLATETGRISGLLAATASLSTPLTRQMQAFSRVLLIAIGGLALATFVVGLLRGEALVDMFMAAVALAVGAIPEGLPAALTVTLAIGVARMARRNAIVRRLPAVEALGGATVICSDKTGTLTENAMTVRALVVGDEHFSVGGSGYSPAGEIFAGVAAQGGAAAGELAAKVGGALGECLVAGALCNDAALGHADGEWRISGDPTEGALLVVARKGGFDEYALRADFPRLDAIPFAAMRQYMASLHRLPNSGGAGAVVYVKGALERILACADRRLGVAGAVLPLAAAARARIEAAAALLAADGMRVLALAKKPLPETALAAPLGEDVLASGLCFIGLVGMIDPPRPRAAAAVAECRRAGISVKMITGDNAGTALAIARQLGIASDGESALSGREIAEFDDAGLAAVVRELNVFARVEPEQKLRLVRALQANGEVVAMTGDGANDAPALRQADIGIAMGRGGTEAAREAADMVLTDDDFATIAAAVEEGRGVYDNLLKFVTWTLPTNFGEGFVIVAAILAGTTLPITPLQILWINMTTAVFLGLTLAFEPIEGELMARRPRPPASPMLDRVLVGRIVLIGLVLLAASFGLFEWQLAQGRTLAEARTAAVNLFVVVQTFYLFSCRSLAQPLRPGDAFGNPLLCAGVGVTVLAQLAFTYLPLMNSLFATAPLAAGTWLEIVGLALLATLVVEAEKGWRRRQRARREGV